MKRSPLYKHKTKNFRIRVALYSPEGLSILLHTITAYLIYVLFDSLSLQTMHGPGCASSSSTWQSISRADRTKHIDCCNNGWVKFADPLLQSCHKVVLLLDWFRGFSIYNVSPDSEHSLGQRWHFVGPTLTNDVGYMSCCSSGRRLPTSPAYVNVYVMPTIISQVLLWTNVGSSWFKGTTFFQFCRKSWFSLLCVINCL